MLVENGSLKEARREFALWRKSKKHGDRIPARLWSLACQVVSELGPTTVAKELGLNSNQLKFEMGLRATHEPVSAEPTVPLALPQPPPSRITVTKVVAVSTEAVDSQGEWEVVSPCGWRFRSRGVAQESQVRAFVMAIRGGGQ